MVNPHKTLKNHAKTDDIVLGVRNLRWLDSKRSPLIFDRSTEIASSHYRTKLGIPIDQHQSANKIIVWIYRPDITVSGESGIGFYR